jgi:hypothetical protein
LNCEKKDRECVYVTNPSKQHPLPLPPLPIHVPSHTDFDQSFVFRPNQTPNLPDSTAPMQQNQYENVYISSRSQSFESVDLLGSHRSNTSSTSSILAPPPIRLPTTTTALVRNGVLVNEVQSHSTLQRAIHSCSKDLRLRGQPFTLEALLSPLIYRMKALKHSIFAHFILQADQARRPLAPTNGNQDFVRLQVRHYNAAITQLKTTFDDPLQTDTNVGASLILAFYNLCTCDIKHWTIQIRNVAEQIRLRGRTIETRPLTFLTKFLFSMYLRVDAVASNSLGQLASADSEIVNIVYSGHPISNQGFLDSRIELELLLIEISRFQYECTILVQLESGQHDASQREFLHHKYDDLIDRLGKWHGLYLGVDAFEEAQSGKYPHGVMLPPEMGLPLLCKVSLEIAVNNWLRVIKSSHTYGFYIVLR